MEILKNIQQLSFNSKGRKFFTIGTKPDDVTEHKLAFSWNLGSIYEGSRLKHVLKRFFTTWQIRRYPNSVPCE